MNQQTYTAIMLHIESEAENYDYTRLLIARSESDFKGLLNQVMREIDQSDYNISLSPYVLSNNLNLEGVKSHIRAAYFSDTGIFTYLDNISNENIDPQLYADFLQQINSPSAADQHIQALCQKVLRTQ